MNGVIDITYEKSNEIFLSFNYVTLTVISPSNQSVALQ